MLISFSDKRKDLFTIIANQLKQYALSYKDGLICIRGKDALYIETLNGDIELIHNKGKTTFTKQS